MVRWNIDYYTSPSGREPAREFIDSLIEVSRTRTYNTFELLAEFGPRLRMPHSRKLTGTPLWELRVLGEASLRFFYVAIINQSFLILHGFTKREQKTPKQEIKVALERLKDHKTRH